MAHIQRAEAEAAPLRAESLLPAVLAARHVWLLSTAPPDHARLWHQTLSDTETELELGQLLPSKQAPGIGVAGSGSHLAHSSLSRLLRGPGRTTITLSRVWWASAWLTASIDVGGQGCLRPRPSLPRLSLPPAPHLLLGGARRLPSAGTLPTWRLLRNAGHCGGGEGTHNAGDLREGWVSCPRLTHPYPSRC